MPDSRSKWRCILKHAFYSAVAIFLLTLFTSLCSGQCANGFSEMTINCAGPHGCTDSVPIFIPDESQDGVRVVCGAVSCCGQLLTSCLGEGGCQDEIMKKPGVRDQVAELAATSKVLVAGCKGRYVPYIAPVYQANGRWRPALLDDLVLR